MINQAPIVQKLDSAIHRINRHLEDKYYETELRYPMDSDLSSGKRYPTFEQLWARWVNPIIFEDQFLL